MQNRARKPKPFESNLPIPVGDFLAYVRKLSVFVSKHATPLSAASSRQLTRQTAKKLDELATRANRQRDAGGILERRVRVNELGPIAQEEIFELGHVRAREVPAEYPGTSRSEALIQ